jgi:hypothetical protein
MKETSLADNSWAVLFCHHDWQSPVHHGRTSKPIPAVVSEAVVQRQEETMAKTKCYTPQLSHEVVSRLYFRAKAERVPMTVLANRIMENALGKQEAITRNAAEKQKQRKPD